MKELNGAYVILNPGSGDARNLRRPPRGDVIALGIMPDAITPSSDEELFTNLALVRFYVFKFWRPVPGASRVMYIDCDEAELISECLEPIARIGTAQVEDEHVLTHMRWLRANTRDVEKMENYGDALYGAEPWRNLLEWVYMRYKEILGPPRGPQGSDPRRHRRFLVHSTLALAIFLLRPEDLAQLPDYKVGLS